jgi:hypothetical protein
MKIRLLLMTILLGLLVGCTDTGDSIAREYRNQINEGLDAMMLVHDEASAHRMTVRIFKPMGDRFKEIDRRLNIVRTNRNKKEFTHEFVLSNSVDLYVTEVIYYNRARYQTELQRIKSLTQRELARAAEREQEPKLKEQEIKRPPGVFSRSQHFWMDVPDENQAPVDVCKALKQLADESALSSLAEQLKSPKMFSLINEIEQYKVTDKIILDAFKTKKGIGSAPMGKLK